MQTKTSLWRHHDFLRLWGAQSVSQVGTQVSFLAIPVIAAVSLDASPREMGLLAAAETSPFLFFGLFAGVVADRMRRRPILIWTDIGRALLIGLIPALWWFDLLSLVNLTILAFGVGVLNVFFEVSYQSYLPALVDRSQLVEGNSKLETSRAGAQVAGPGLAGGLIQVAGAPIAVILDAASFLVSGLLLSRIQATEPAIEKPEEPASVWTDVRAGVSYILRHPLLRPIAFCTGTLNFFGGMLMALFVIFATRELGLSAGAIGIVFATGSLGFISGAVVAGRVGRVLGVGPAIIAGAAIAGFGQLGLAFANGSQPLILATLVGALAISGAGGAIYNITQVSLRQSITPDRMLGRMNATMRFLVWGTLPLGNLAGGLMGDALGLRSTLVFAGVGSLFAALWPAISDVRWTRDYPIPADAYTAEAASD